MADIPVTGGSPQVHATQGPSYVRRAQAETQTTETGSAPLQEMTLTERREYESYLNRTLGAVDQLRYPACFPDLQQMAAANQGNEQHGTEESHDTEGEHGGEHETEGAHGGEHGGWQSTYIKTTHVAEYTHSAIEHGLEAFGHGAHGAHAPTVPHTAATVPVTPQPTPAVTTPTPPPVNTPVAPQATGTGAGTPQIPLREPISEDMRLYVEAVRNSQPGGTTTATTAAEGTAGAGASTTPTTGASTPRVPLREPISEDMRLYVEAVREGSKTPPSGTTPAGTAPAGTAPSGTPGTVPRPTGEVPVETTGAPTANSTESAVEAAGQGGSKLHNALNAANKVLGPAAVVAGGLEAYHGINELREGKTFDGTMDVAGGAAGITSGAAVTTMAYSSATTVAGVGLGAVAAGAGGVVAVADGVKDIYHGIKEGNVEKGVVGGVKTAAGAAMIAGACTGNPVLIAGGAITYAGAIVYENREAIADGAKKAAHWTADKASQGYHAAKEAVGGAVHKAGELKDAAVHKAGELKDAAVQKAGEVKDAVVHKAGEIKDAVAGGLSSAADTVSGGAKKAWNWATSLW